MKKTKKKKYLISGIAITGVVSAVTAAVAVPIIILKNNQDNVVKEFISKDAIIGENTKKTGDGSGKTYTKAQIDARDAKGPYPTKNDAVSGKINANIKNSKKIDGIGDSSENTYTQDQINHAKGDDFIAPKNAIEGINSKTKGDGSGKTYTKAQIDARDAKGPYPTKNDALSGKVNANIKNSKKIDGIGDSSENTYTQDQINHAKGDDFIAPKNAIEGINSKTKGDGSGKTYTKAQIDARDAKGPYPTKNDAVSGKVNANIKNSKKIDGIGDSSENTYTQAQIDKAKGGNFVAPKNAVEGLNNDNIIDKKPSNQNSMLLEKLISRLNTYGLLPVGFTFSNIDSDDIEKAVIDFEKAIEWDKMTRTMGTMTYAESVIEQFKKHQKRNLTIDINNKKIDIQFYIDQPKTGDGSGKTYTKAQIDARDAKGPYPAKNDAVSGKVNANIKNSKKIDGIGDSSENTYTQDQINHAKGGNFVAPKNTVEGINSKAKGDGSGKTYTKAQIDARDAKGPYPTKNDAVSGKVNANIKNSKKIDGIGDLSENTYTQDQINHAKGDDFIAPKNAIEGINSKTKGDGSGKTYTKAQIDARDAKGPYPAKNDAVSGKVNANIKNSKKIDGIGDLSENTYTQAQIDKAKGGNFVAPKNAIKGINSKAKGDGSGKTYTEEEINKRMK